MKPHPEKRRTHYLGAKKKFGRLSEESFSHFGVESTNYQSATATEKRKREEILRQQNAISVLPLLVTSVEFTNYSCTGKIVECYSCALHSKNVLRLKPRIKYIGKKTGERIEIYAKFYDPNGQLLGENDPIFVTTQSGSDNIATLNSYAPKLGWRKGTYMVEIWHESNCIKRQAVTLF